MGKLIVTFRDYGEPPERSAVQVAGPDMTAGNFAAEATLIDSLVAAIEGMSLGTKTKTSRVAVEAPYPETQPASPYAQRETKWLVRFRDTVTGEKGSLEIPCADLTLLDSTSQGKADMANASVAAFVSAYEAYALSPAGVRGQVEIYEIVHVGRNI